MNDLTRGNIFKSLMVFMIPILLANIFQQLYNTADTMIVGHYLGDNALAAMGATASVFELLVGFANGVGNGYSVVIARFIGARDNIRVKKAVATGIILTAILSLIIMGLSISILRPLMTLLNTPEEIFEVAYGYLFTVCIFVAVTAFYNLSGGILRAKGNSFIPLIMLFISSVLNIILDIIFIGYMHMGVKGAAIATVIAQFVSAVLCITYILVKEKDILPDKEHFIYDKDIYKDMIAQGLSMGLMMSIVSMGTVILSGAINKLGKDIIASYISARKIMSFGLIIISTLASSLTTFVSQNLGAKEYQRINDGIKISTGISIIWSLIMIIVLYAVADKLIYMISSSDNMTVINNGSMYLKISCLFYPPLAVLCNLRCALQGLGKKIIPLISSIIELLGKIVFVIFIVPVYGFMGVIMCEPVIWIFMMFELLWAYLKARKEMNDEISREY